MPYPTQQQEQAIIECETLLDYYMPAMPGIPGVDTDARACLRIAGYRCLSDAERDALIRFVMEWVQGRAREVELDRQWEDACANGEVPA